jgi:integrase
MAGKRKMQGAGRVCLRKRGKFYTARLTYQGERRQLPLKVGNLTAAEDKAREMEKMCERGVDWDLVEQSLSLDKKGVTLADIWEKFQKTGAWSESTKRQDRSTVENFILKALPGSLNQITEAQIRGYLQRRSEEDGLAKTSINKHLAIIKALFRYATEKGYIAQNPASEVKVSKIGKKKPRPYFEGEIEALREVLEPRHTRIMDLYLNTGMRRGELMGLPWRDVDFGRQVISIRDPKNDEDRELDMNETVLHILQSLKADQKKSAAIQLLVLGSLADIRQVLYRAMQSANEGKETPPFPPDRIEWIRPLHSLRDTFGTRLADNGVNLQEIAELMGHKSLEMTRRYVKNSRVRLRAAVVGLEA